jgi:hypothetical protein
MKYIKFTYTVEDIQTYIFLYVCLLVYLWVVYAFSGSFTPTQRRKGGSELNDNLEGN